MTKILDCDWDLHVRRNNTPMARSRATNGGPAALERKMLARIENIDNHVILSLNIIKQALKEGSFAMTKLGEGIDDYENAFQTLDFKPSEGGALIRAQEICFSSPGDAVTRVAEGMREKTLPGPWLSWTSSPFS